MSFHHHIVNLIFYQARLKGLMKKSLVVKKRKSVPCIIKMLLEKILRFQSIAKHGRKLFVNISESQLKTVVEKLFFYFKLTSMKKILSEKVNWRLKNLQKMFSFRLLNYYMLHMNMSECWKLYMQVLTLYNTTRKRGFKMKKPNSAKRRAFKVLNSIDRIMRADDKLPLISAVGYSLDKTSIRDKSIQNAETYAKVKKQLRTAYK